MGNKSLKIIKIQAIVIFVIVMLSLGSKASYAQWVDRNAAAGASTTNIKGAGVSSNGQTMIIVGDAGFIKTSTNGGASWTDRNAVSGAGAGNVNATAIGPSGEMIAVGDSGYIRTSTDGGASWTNRNAAAGAGTTALRAAHIGPTGIMLVVGDGGYIRSSTNGGANWTDHNSACGCATLFMLGAAVGPSSKMFAVATDAKFVSTNNGANWSSLSTNSSDLYSAAIGSNGNYIAGGTGPSYLQTSTDGSSWSDRAAAAGLSTQNVRAVSIGPSGEMYAGGTAGFIKQSTDGGASWSDLNSASGIGASDVRDIDVDSSGNLIVVGTSGYVRTYSVNTAPTITNGPLNVVGGTYTRLSANNTTGTFGVTVSDGQQTGSNALTYYVHTGANRTGTQVTTGTLTSGNASNPSIAYNAPGIVNGNNTLYFSVFDGTNYSVANPTFLLIRDDVAPTASTNISTTPSPVTATSYSFTFTPNDAASTGSNEMSYQIRTAAGGGGTLLTSGTTNSTSGSPKTTSSFTDATLIPSGNTRYIRTCDGANNCTDTSFVVTYNPLPGGVGTDDASDVYSYYVKLNGVANPNGVATHGHFRVFDYDPTNCNSDASGAPAGKNNYRFPAIDQQDVYVEEDAISHIFSFTIPFNSNTFLYPNTKYWYCSYANNSNGTVGGSSVRTFITGDGPASPCDAPASGSLSIPAGAACRFSGNYNGVDEGAGGTNTATLTLNTGNQITLNPGQRIGRGTLSLRGGRLTLAAGASIVRGGVFVHDKDADGVLDDGIQYVGSTASASTEFVRRNTMSTTLFNYSWKIASGGATFDCNQNSAYVNRYVPGIQMVTDADNDGYKTSAAASTQCVGQQSVINGRTYYKDASNSYTWLASTAVLGGGATDCQDDPNGGPCAPSSLTASNPTSQTQNTLSWSGTQTGGAVPATTAYDVQWCPGVACSPPTGGGTLSNFASGSDHTGLSASTTYGYKVAAKNGAIVGTYSGVQYATTQAACTNTTIYPDTDGDTYGNSGTIYQGAVVQKYNNTSASSITITKPADIVNGELMIAVIGWGGGSNRSITSVPSGWTQIGATATNGTATNIAAYYKYASGEGANYTWDFSSSEQQTGFITSYGNAILSPSNPVDVSSTSTGTSTNLTVTGISLNSANEMLVMAVGANPGAASVTFNSAPAGMNEIAKINSSTSESGGAGDILAGYSEWRSSGGATGDKTAVISGSKAYAGIIFALKRPAQVSDVQCLTGGPPGGWALNSNDCDDTTSNYYQTQLTSRIQDFDTDGQGIGSQITVCKGASTRPGTTTNTNLDCYDNNANAYVGQSTYFTSGRGDGSFDYDCNAANDRNPSIISSAEYYSGSSSCLSGTCNKSSRDSTNSCFVVDPTCSGGYNMCNFLGTPVSSSTSCGLILQAKLYDDQACTNWGGVITLSFAHIMSCK